MDTEASSNPEVNKDQDEVATADTEGTEDLDLYSSFLIEVTEDQEVIGVGDRYEVNTQKTPYYYTKMCLYVANIYEN